MDKRILSENKVNDRFGMKSNFHGLICLFALLLVSITYTDNINAQQVCFNYRGQWSDWVNLSDGYKKIIYDVGGVWKYNDYSGLILKSSGGIEFFKFQINNYVPPTKKQLKEHRKNNEWFSYQGTVDYYVSDVFPTAEAFCKASGFVVPNPRRDETPTVKRHTVCEIRIAPFKKHPELYLIIFDNVGIEISIQGLIWTN